MDSCWVFQGKVLGHNAAKRFSYYIGLRNVKLVENFAQFVSDKPVMTVRNGERKNHGLTHTRNRNVENLARDTKEDRIQSRGNEVSIRGQCT